MQRLYYFDNIKIVLIIFVILIHSGLAYIPNAEGWVPSYPGPLPFADVLIVGTVEAVAGAFAMALFFFISAYLLVGSFDRKGRAKFLKDRLVRIGIPLVGSAVLWFIVLAAAGISYVFPGWLWFLVYLLILAVAYSIWRRFDVTVCPVACPKAGILVLVALVLGAANFVVRAWYPTDVWVLWHVVEPAHIPLYALFMIGASSHSAMSGSTRFRPLCSKCGGPSRWSPSAASPCLSQFSVHRKSQVVSPPSRFSRHSGRRS